MSRREAILNDDRAQTTSSRMPLLMTVLVMVGVMLTVLGKVIEQIEARGGQYAEAAEQARTIMWMAPFAVIGLAILGVVVAVSAPYVRTAGRQLASRKRYQIATFGVHRRVSTRPSDRLHGAQCVNCGKQSASGVVREWAKEYVFGGVAIWTSEHGGNHYCSVCDEADPVQYALRAGKHESLTELSESELEEIEMEMEAYDEQEVAA